MTLRRLSNNWLPSFPSFFNHFFEDELMDWDSNNYSGANNTLPAVNVLETDTAYQIKLAAPGMKKKDFNVSYENGRLNISSELKKEHQEKDGHKITRLEYSYQSFKRSFNIAENSVKADKIKAEYKDGILNITLPKQDAVITKPSRIIEIQ
ncbi:Hsp20/alpha crystallin family protein [Labilibacter sediminis]|nr:Hsp20/alpha crystallin family protein [Labilibacter sediminis]